MLNTVIWGKQVEKRKVELELEIEQLKLELLIAIILGKIEEEKKKCLKD